MAGQNQAAWIDAVQTPIKVSSADMPVPGPDEVLIHNGAVAINPVDWKQAEYGFMVKKWPTIFGNDVAGTVVEVGSNVTNFSKGQRVMGHCIFLVTGNIGNAGFQLYTTVPALLTAPIPESMSFESATVLPLAISTAAAGLFQDDGLALPLPTAHPKSTGKTVLVWGGSSSVGTQAIQLAVAAGAEVVAVASKKNFDYCKALGAKAVFDYKSPSIVGDLTEELQKGGVYGAYDAVGDKDTTLNIATVLAQLGGGKIASTGQAPEGIPATVEVKSVFAVTIALSHKDVGKGVYGDFLPQALASGQLKPLPEAMVIGKGLEYVQEGIDKLKAGVSAAKVVVAL